MTEDMSVWVVQCKLHYKELNDVILKILKKKVFTEYDIAPKHYTYLSCSKCS